MRKQKPVALYVASILVIIFGALYLYTRPGTIEELYDFVDLDKIDMTASYVRIYEKGDSPLENSYQTKWLLPGEEGYDVMMEMLQETTFQRTLKTLTPLPETRTSPHLEDGMKVLEVMYHNEECGFHIQSFYGETTISFYDRTLGEQYITVKDQDAWEQKYVGFIMEYGSEAPVTVVDMAG